MSNAMVAARIPEAQRALVANALEAAGFSASEAIRALWAYAARNAAQPDAIAKELRMLSGIDDDDDANRKIEAVHLGVEQVASLRRELGTDSVSLPALDYKQLRELADEEGYGRDRS